MKTSHGHYSDKFKEEGERIQKLCKELLNVEITWMEATAIAALRSQTTFWDGNKLKEVISKLRGL
jgi:hypothetical protein